MPKSMDLVAVHLPFSMNRLQLQELLDISLIKSIEATFYARVGSALLTYTQFNVLTFIDFSRSAIIDALEKLGVPNAQLYTQNLLTQDYPIRIDESIAGMFHIDNNSIVLREESVIHLIIIAHVISQSVALEFYENRLVDYFERSRNLIERADTQSLFQRNKLARFSKELVLMRHDILIDLHLLDKPNILWDNEEAELLYNRLSYALELKARFDIIEYKLNNIKDDIGIVLDLTQHNHSSFLEWIIIVLIGVEIVMGLAEWAR
ncbi:MAG: hypothetical protein KU37_11790 [Sulfuricurvum sp. PC08-66]|nr:MAG: hypothetical protein KU37_11790 [Sulfuricurvum sp. PC08-66]